MNEGLHLDNVTIARRGGAQLLSVDAHIAPGEIFTLMGPSGSGKSTLINAISGFLPRAFTCTGTVTLGGKVISNMPPEKRCVGVLFQDPLLFPHLSVVENVMFALPPGGSKRHRLKRAEELLEAVNLLDCGEQDPATLSGGQQARVALIRVIAAEPRALLLDEPFSKLDAELRDAVRQLVFTEVRRRNLPALFVTHDRADAEAAGGKMLMVNS